MECSSPVIRRIYGTFIRHGRWYCFFSVEGQTADYVYYSDRSMATRSLLSGKDFGGQLPELMKKEDQCIECGLGITVERGIILENREQNIWHFSAEEANAILTSLKQYLGAEGTWIRLF